MSVEVLNESVLVLNSTYEAINICNVRRAIVLVFNGNDRTWYRRYCGSVSTLNQSPHNLYAQDLADSMSANLVIIIFWACGEPAP